MLLKNTLRKIVRTLGCFISLFLIIAIGAGFYGGIVQAVPNIKTVQNSYDRKQNLMDFKIVSTLGLTTKDIQPLKSDSVKKVEGSYSLEALDRSHAIAIHAITAINKPYLIKGRQPQNSCEVLADSRHYQLGDQLTIRSTKLKKHHLKVVGLISSPLYATTHYGNASIGDGQLYSFLYAKASLFNIKTYTEIYIVFNKPADDDYSTSYKSLIRKQKKKILTIAARRQKARQKELQDQAYAKLQPQIDKLEKEKKKANDQFKKAQSKIDHGQSQLKQAQATLNKQKRSAEARLRAARKQLNQAQKKLDAQKAQISTLDTTIKELTAQSKQLTKAINAAKDDSQTAQAYEKQRQTINENLSRLKTQKQNYNTAVKKLQTSARELTQQEEQSKQKFNQAQATINKQSKSLKAASRQLDKQKQTYRAKIKKAEDKLAEAKKDIAAIPAAKWYISDRNDIVTDYKVLETQYEEVRTIVRVIPLFFVIIVLLMSSNTMARMISQDRGEMGTLSSLGFSNGTIIRSYLSYVLSATVSGCLIGYFIGVATLPKLVYNCFPVNWPALPLFWSPPRLLAILAVMISLMCYVTLHTCRKDLKNMPSYLLRPLPPGGGSRVIFERFPIFWKHVSFSWKVTLRNLSRYKKRGIITIVGTLGCTTLILLGFGLRDGINTVGIRQYRECFRYDRSVILEKAVTSETAHLKKLLSPYLKNRIYVSTSSYTVNKDGIEVSFYTMVIKGNNYAFNLKSPSGKALHLNNSGVIITEKMAKLYHLKSGDTLTFTDDHHRYKMTISGITHNYVANYAYMTPSYYRRIFNKSCRFNMVVGQKTDKKVNVQTLIKDDSILSYTSREDAIDQANNQVSGLNEIVIMLVIISSLLAFTVLYNLTSINIAERTREIATLKVLGFKNSETNQYIYRETMISLIIGLIAGLIFTTLIFPMIMNLVETNDTIFLKTIKPVSYLYTALIVISFGIIMNFVTYFKVNVIAMIESLKSVE